jgi:hypothetical protein
MDMLSEERRTVRTTSFPALGSDRVQRFVDHDECYGDVSSVILLPIKGGENFMKKNALLMAVVLVLSGAAQSTQTGVAETADSHCMFHHVDNLFVGSCGPLFDQRPTMTIRSAGAITTGVWRDDIRPDSVWAGDMTDEGYPNDQTELEIYKGGWGLLRTVYGWFPVVHFVVSSTVSFDLDSSQEVKPNILDQNVQQAAEILSTETAWNRADNRECPPDATTWSIYCALEKATIAITGGFHHRRPAMEVVRTIIDERTAMRNYHHRLMDYNNDPTTHLSDIQSLFNEALKRMGKR